MDDEAPAREELRFLLDGFDDVQVVGEATNGEEALTLLESLDYDVVLLDIRMPGGTGLDVARALRQAPQRPAVIFTTAYGDHAVEAFDLAAADYLVKPFDAERLRRALDRALGHSDDEEPRLAPSSSPPQEGAPEAGSGTEETGKEPPTREPGRSADAGSPTGEAAKERTRRQGPPRIPVQRGDRTVLVDPREIVYAEAARGYSALKLREERVLVTFTLSELERRLGPRFFRTHRSYLVNLDYVRELMSDYQGALVLVLGDGSRVDVSRRQARDLRRLLGI
ncbi:LytR/AlgR family response regulator transcription factor [Egibacter rhizosphaerae]|uniref:LytR/AlgR family response regulator transcription factor n=1 Tax=Egibacter rhizosphaerae TaxID=1670831 RepID=UPI00197AFAE6|nr:LytTR family DNA-binding domain-containing protein [Egibacter rhizosphaerae]